MLENQASQSLSISGSQISGTAQIGQAGQDSHQIQQLNQTIPNSDQLTSGKTLELIAQLEALLKGSVIPEAQKEKAMKHLEAAKEEAREEQPDKEYAAKSLQKVTKVLKDANETVEAGQGIWEKAKPIITALLPWLGAVPHFFGL